MIFMKHIWERKELPTEEEIQKAWKDENFKQICSVSASIFCAFFSLFWFGFIGFTIIFTALTYKTYAEKIRIQQIYVNRYLEKRWLKNGKTNK